MKIFELIFIFQKNSGKLIRSRKKERKEGRMVAKWVNNIHRRSCKFIALLLTSSTSQLTNSLPAPLLPPTNSCCPVLNLVASPLTPNILLFSSLLSRNCSSGIGNVLLCFLSWLSVKTMALKGQGQGGQTINLLLFYYYFTIYIWSWLLL